jgi:hypothetical protein
LTQTFLRFFLNRGAVQGEKVAELASLSEEDGTLTTISTSPSSLFGLGPALRVISAPSAH